LALSYWIINSGVISFAACFITYRLDFISSARNFVVVFSPFVHENDFTSFAIRFKPALLLYDGSIKLRAGLDKITPEAC
jgi:hypothetical protein